MKVQRVGGRAIQALPVIEQLLVASLAKRQTLRHRPLDPLPNLYPILHYAESSMPLLWFGLFRSCRRSNGRWLRACYSKEFLQDDLGNRRRRRAAVPAVLD